MQHTLRWLPSAATATQSGLQLVLAHRDSPKQHQETENRHGTFQVRQLALEASRHQDGSQTQKPSGTPFRDCARSFCGHLGQTEELLWPIDMLLMSARWCGRA